MFVAVREIKSARGRFGLIAGTVALITLLVVMLTGLTQGLGKQNTSALEALNPAAVIFQDNHDPSFTTSRMQARPGTVPLGTGQLLIKRADGTEEAIAILALPEGTELPTGVRLGSGAVASESLNVAAGEKVTIGGTALQVDATTDSLEYSHSPVLWVPTPVWQRAMHTDADGTVLLADESTASEGISLRSSFAGLPAYGSERGSLLMIQGFLYAIAALVIVAFLTVWTMQRTRDLAILKAIGASNSYLRKDALGQSALILAAGALLGAAVGLGIGAFISGVAPFSLSPLSAAIPPLGIFVLGMVGAFIATRSITKVQPQLALGGIA